MSVKNIKRTVIKITSAKNIKRGVKNISVLKNNYEREKYKNDCRKNNEC